jgi:hypothetical protein
MLSLVYTGMNHPFVATIGLSASRKLRKNRLILVLLVLYQSFSFRTLYIQLYGVYDVDNYSVSFLSYQYVGVLVLNSKNAMKNWSITYIKMFSH